MGLKQLSTVGAVGARLELVAVAGLVVWGRRRWLIGR